MPNASWILFRQGWAPIPPRRLDDILKGAAELLVHATLGQALGCNLPGIDRALFAFPDVRKRLLPGRV
jgi:hypothetical protein